MTFGYARVFFFSSRDDETLLDGGHVTAAGGLGAAFGSDGGEENIGGSATGSDGVGSRTALSSFRRTEMEGAWELGVATSLK